MKAIFSIFTIGVTLLIICNSCLSNNLRNEGPDTLRERIYRYYDLLKNRQFNECYHFWNTNVLGSKDEFVSYARKANLDITSYEIQDLLIENLEAKAIMHVSVSENGNNYESVHSDLWKFIKGQWYLVDFGRGEGKDTVQEFNYPEDYHKLDRQ
jgi:hypothetical protein